MEYVRGRVHSGLRGAWRKSLDFLVLEGRLSVAFFLFLFASRKTKVSDREFDSRGRHSACETVIAVHMVK